MAETFIATVGTPALVKADVGLRVYDATGAPAATATAAATWSEIGSSGDYKVTAPLGPWYTVTWEYPAGVGGFYTVKPADLTEAPDVLVIPVRESGLSVGDLNLALYKDGVARADALSAVEVGSPGDYKVSGWPTDESGEWVLRWSRGGFTVPYGWVVEIPAAGPTDWQERDYARVAAVIGAGTWSGASDNWLGIHDPLAWPYNDPPQPSTDPGHPTLFAVWGIDYEEVVRTLDDSAEPLRRGEVPLEFWIQVGAGMGAVLDLATQARANFTGQNSGGCVFLPATARPEYLGTEGSFAGYRLPIPFYGGAQS